MHKGRLEALSDGVLAIIITIMVLEIKTPEGADLHSLRPLVPVILSYVLSFIYVGIYWNNHHHLFQAVQHISGRVLWANLHLLFWLSLVPFGTRWIAQDCFDKPIPVALYGGVLLLAGVAYFILSQALIDQHGRDSLLAKAVGSDRKGVVSVVIYAIAIAAAFFSTWISLALYVCVAAIWLIPDRRIEDALK